jgi:hypothetical protein
MQEESKPSGQELGLRRVLLNASAVVAGGVAGAFLGFAVAAVYAQSFPDGMARVFYVFLALIFLLPIGAIGGMLTVATLLWGARRKGKHRP